METTESATTRAVNLGSGNTSAGSFYFTIIIYFAVIALIIGGFIFLRKYLLNRVGSVKGGAGMKIKDRLIIAQDKQIIMLEVKNKIFMIGISAQSMSALGEFEKDEIYDGDNIDCDGEPDLNKNKFLSILSEKN